MDAQFLGDNESGAYSCQVHPNRSLGFARQNRRCLVLQSRTLTLMDWPQLLALPLRFAILFAGLLGPGTLLLRTLELPRSLAGAFLVSAVVLHGVVLALAFTGLPIDPATLAGGLVLIATGTFIVARGKPAVASTEEGLGAMFTRWSPWTLFYAAVWLALVYRLGTQPLTGPDIGFRWSWLAEQMLRQGSLDFYPPHSATDFTQYFWAESIPPGVASLYAWSYACGGGFDATWTSPVVLLQFLALHDLVWRLAHRMGGEPAARLSVLLLAATPLLNWSVVIGQETGLTAIGVCGLVYALTRWAGDRSRGSLLLAGFSAALVAGAREYGVAFGVLGAMVLLFWRAPVWTLTTYALAALLLPALWFGFVWLKTGNPVYSLGLAGLFPVNEVFDRYTAFVRLLQSAGLFSADGLYQLARYLLLFALPACAGLTLAVWRARITFTLATVFLVAAMVFWIISIGYTAGGLFYSMRVLSPVFALAAVLGGVAAAEAAGNSSSRRMSAVLLLVLGLESLPKTLVLPVNPYRAAPVDWLQAGGEFVGRTARADAELLPVLRSLPDRPVIITESAGLQRLLADTGLTVVPVWSPAASWLFDPQLPPADFTSRLGAFGDCCLILTRDSHGARFVQAYAHPALGAHLQLHQVSDQYVVYRVRTDPGP